jgi:hypothetical protein
MKLADLLATTEVVQFSYQGMPVTLTVRSQVLTSEMFSTLARMGTKTNDPEVIAGQLDAIPPLICQLVASWDFQDDEGAPFPL